MMFPGRTPNRSLAAEAQVSRKQDVDSTYWAVARFGAGAPEFVQDDSSHYIRGHRVMLAAIADRDGAAE